jgi:hypothetical protein
MTMADDLPEVGEEELAQIEQRAQALPSSLHTRPDGTLLKEPNVVAGRQLDSEMATFLVHARDDVLRLVATVRRLRALLAQADTHLEQTKHAPGGARSEDD